MKQKTLIILSCTAILISSLAAMIAPALAADNTGPLNLTTSPVPIDLAGLPGTTLSTDLRIKNNSPQTEKLKVTLMKFSAYGNTGKPALAERAPGDNYFDWVSFSPSSFDAPTEVWITVKMTIKMPKDAALGYYYAVVFSRASNPAATPGERQNLIIGSTAVMVLVEAQVPGAKRTAQLVDFSTDHRSYEFLPANFSITLHNSGNVHFVPHGDIFITRGKSQIADLRINTGQGNILPGTNRVFTASWSDGFPVYVDKVTDGKTVKDKQGNQVKTLQWNFSHIQKLRFGHYTAHLLMVYDNGQRDVPIEATVSFWVIPWRVVGISLIALTLIGAGSWSISRSTWRRVKKVQTKETQQKIWKE